MADPTVFSDLWVGDRFNAYGELWTKQGHDAARQHSKESIALGARGYGYIGDTICSFEPEDAVEFVPPAAPVQPSSNEQQESSK
jgi:hypothetical protein